jgi:hypothetical protein
MRWLAATRDELGARLRGVEADLLGIDRATSSRRASRCGSPSAGSGIPPSTTGASPDGMLELCLVEVIAAGPRLQYEFEQLLPGGEDPDAGDPILDAIELRDRGYPERARALLDSRA